MKNSVWIVIALAMFACGKPDLPETELLLTPQAVERTDATVAPSLDVGMLKRVDVANHEAQIGGSAWSFWDMETRRAFSERLAMYCAGQAGSSDDTAFVDVIDAECGHAIATTGVDSSRSPGTRADG